MSTQPQSARSAEGYAREVFGTVSIDSFAGTITVTPADTTAAPSTRHEALILRELRGIRVLLATAQGLPAIFEPLPDVHTGS